MVLFPLSVPAIKSQKKIQNLKPELDKLKTVWSWQEKTSRRADEVVSTAQN